MTDQVVTFAWLSHQLGHLLFPGIQLAICRVLIHPAFSLQAGSCLGYICLQPFLDALT